MNKPQQNLINDIFKQTLHAHLQENADSDPYAPCRFASQEILARLTALTQDDKGIHIESTLVLLGSLAGYASLQYANSQTSNPQEVLRLINEQLLGDTYSLHNLLNGALNHHHAPLLNTQDIINHVQDGLGKAHFGTPRLPKGHDIKYPPIECVALWEVFEVVLADFLVTPDKAVVAFGVAIQDFIGQAKTLLDPTLLATLALECAISMGLLHHHHTLTQAQSNTP